MKARVGRLSFGVCRSERSRNRNTTEVQSGKRDWKDGRGGQERREALRNWELCSYLVARKVLDRKGDFKAAFDQSGRGGISARDVAHEDGEQTKNELMEETDARVK